MAMKKFLLTLLVIILVLVAVWPDSEVDSSVIKYTIQEVIDGNTIKLDNGTTVHLIGVSNTNEAMEELESMTDKEIYLVADESYPFNPIKIGKSSTVYAYIILNENQECVNAIFLKERLAELQEETFLKDSLLAFRKYAKMAKKEKRETPTPAPQLVIDYDKDEIVLPPYTFANDRKHSIWHENGNMNVDMLNEACDFNLPYTKSFANQLAKRAPGPFNFRQVCEIFDYCYTNWSYVNDPKHNEYVAKASESIASSLSGDCDDFAVLMASCIIAIGGDASITSAYNGDSGHAYAELNITNMDLDDIKTVLEERYPHVSLDEVYTRTDDYGVWLNLDWQANYPGGRYWEATERNAYVHNNQEWKWIRY